MRESMRMAHQDAVEALVELLRPGSEPAWERIEHLSDDFVAAAERHNVVPIVSRTVEERDAPPALVDALRTRAKQLAEHSLLLASQLVELSQEFDRVGIDAVSYKGPTLASEAYGDIGSR